MRIEEKTMRGITQPASGSEQLNRDLLYFLKFVKKVGCDSNLQESLAYGGNKSGCNRFGLCNRSSHHYGEGAEIEGPANLIRVSDVAFDDHGKMQSLDQLLYQHPVDRTLSQGGWGVSKHSSCHRICSCLFSGTSLVETGNISQHRFVELLPDA